MSPLSAAALVALACEAAAIASLLRAGRAYVRGELERARRGARRAALPAAGAALVAAVLLVASGSDPAAAALASASGAAALLGGLSLKPRPAGEWAALLWLAAVVAIVARRLAP